ncbi:unnamed protein product [Heligmosomoides polygyrus]|uniref:Uncharacterized protein n=1 Tax=Heligmosomoides polygyrus TaxID=6339 RepID=A0A183GG35_HELPZ|nr:unnamed protein product [Heligmosomoides polygyrus]
MFCLTNQSFPKYEQALTHIGNREYEKRQEKFIPRGPHPSSSCCTYLHSAPLWSDSAAQAALKLLSSLSRKYEAGFRSLQAQNCLGTPGCGSFKPPAAVEEQRSATDQPVAFFDVD